VRWKSGEAKKGALHGGCAAVGRGAEGTASGWFSKMSDMSGVLYTIFKSPARGYTKLLHREIAGYPQDRNKKPP